MKKLITYFIIVMLLYINTISCFSYSDILVDLDWAKSSIEMLTNKGIISGYPEGGFSPYNAVKRSEIAKMMIIAFGKAELVSYYDVLQSDWYYPYVANSGGLFSKSEIFKPNEYATREVVALAIFNALKLTNQNKEINFYDKDEISSECKNAVEVISQYGIIDGYPDNTFKPTNSITRAEAAVIINRAIAYIKAETPTPTPTLKPTQSPISTPIETFNPIETPLPTATSSVDQQAKSNNYFFLVKKVTQALNTDGDPVTKVYGYNDGIEETIEIGDVEITCTKIVRPADNKIKDNDIISFYRDYFGKVRYAQIIFRQNTQIPQADIQILKYSNGSINRGIVYAYVSKKYRNIALDLKISLTDTDSRLYSVSDNANIYIYRYNKIVKGDVDDIYDTTYSTVEAPMGDRILAYFDDDELKEILVIK